VALCLNVAAKSPFAFTFANALGTGLETRNSTLASVDPKLFAQLSESARAVAADGQQAEAKRIEATSFLGMGRDAASRSALIALLSPSTPVPLQGAVVRALAQRRELTNALAHWPQLSRPARESTVALLMKRRDGALALVRAAEQGTVARNEIAAADVERLMTHADAKVREIARVVFKRDESTRAEAIKKYQPALNLKGDATRGQQSYQQRCASCHRAGTEGFAVGPDLASVAANGKEKLLVSILDPNAEVASAYVAYSVETKRGDSFVGVLGGESPLHVLLKMPNGETARLGRETIAAARAGDKSLMPEGLEEGLSAQDMADLLEFLVTAKPAP
jgi:putative heme-binding domain-containing protein